MLTLFWSIHTNLFEEAQENSLQLACHSKKLHLLRLRSHVIVRDCMCWNSMLGRFQATMTTSSALSTPLLHHLQSLYTNVLPHASSQTVITIHNKSYERLAN